MEKSRGGGEWRDGGEGGEGGQRLLHTDALEPHSSTLNRSSDKQPVSLFTYHMFSTFQRFLGRGGHGGSGGGDSVGVTPLSHRPAVAVTGLFHT